MRALPQDSLLFPGLKRRASKGGKIGARIGELFRKKLIALGMKRDGLCFHYLRNTVAQRLEAAAVSQTDAARVTGHAIEGMTYSSYGHHILWLTIEQFVTAITAKVRHSGYSTSCVHDRRGRPYE
jgi:integrase